MIKLGLCLLAFTVCALAFGQQKEEPPEGGPPKPFHLPATEDFTLPNGMKVTLVPYGSVPRVAVRAFVSKHSVHAESARQHGDVVTLEIFVPEPFVQEIKDKALKVEVLFDASARGRERQKEVGVGNRFAEGQLFPKGLGAKTREDR